MSNKERLEDLAILGGIPAFEEPLHVGRPNIGDRERLLSRINDMLDRRWLSNHGPFVQELEQQLCKRIGVRHCIAVCNATIGLEIAIRALGLIGEVIVPSFTFIATAHALQWQGITPAFCDVDPCTHNLRPQQVEQKITSRTTGILGVHLWGQGCCAEALTEIAERHHLKLLFDAAHAFGSSYQGRMIGNFGDAEVYSFHATKFFNAFEGGAIVTNNGELAAKIRLMTNFGFAGYDNVVSLGTNGKMNEASAAMALTGLESLDAFVAVNCRNYQQYRQEFADIPGIALLTYNEAEKNNYQYIVLTIDEEVTQISRDQLMDLLWAENVMARRYFYPGCHRMEPYLSLYPEAGLSLPETERLCRSVLTLPTGTAVGQEEISKIAHLIRFAVQHGQNLRARLRA